MASDEILTIVRPADYEIEKIKGSRFIAHTAPVSDESAVFRCIEDVARRQSGATHHCWAYRLSNGSERSFDDGEPGGTAGSPILQRIVGAGLHDVIVVVSRFYGGTNLGRGGLIRAYGKAGAAVLDVATTVRKQILSEWLLAHPYDLTTAVAGVVNGFGAETLAAEYGEVVKVVVAVPARHATEFAQAIVDATSGAVLPQPWTTIS